MKFAVRTLAGATAALALLGGAPPARSADVVVSAGVGYHGGGPRWGGPVGPRFAARGGYYHHGSGYRGYWGPGLFLGGVGLGLGIAALNGYAYGPPAYVIETPPPAVVYAPPPPAAPTARSAPDPIIYPRDGQSAAQLEADRQACNRWAATQPSALADASVFQRATQACLEGRGYTVR